VIKEGEALAHAELIAEAKQLRAHTYLTTKFDCANLFEVFGRQVDLEAFMKKAV